jgi:hypothetical protein
VKCQQCQDAPAISTIYLHTPDGIYLRRPDGGFEQGYFCEACHYARFGKRPTLFQTRSYFPLFLILVALDTILVCIATAPWLLIGPDFPGIVFAPIVNGPLIGLLLCLQILLLTWLRDRQKPKPDARWATARGDRPSKMGLYDRDLDG